MVYVSTVQTLHHEQPRETEILTYFQRFFINVFCAEVFSDAAIVSVWQLYRIVFIIEQIVYINIVDIALDALQINVTSLLLTTSRSTIVPLPTDCNTVNSCDTLDYSPLVLSSIVVGIIFVVFFFRVILVGLFEPVMS